MPQLSAPEASGRALPSEPEGRGPVWTDERGACDERGGKTGPISAPEASGRALRVVVADDQALVRVGFCGIIAATPGYTVVGQAGNGAEAVEAARQARPDVILMDVRMPVMDGIEATRRITASTDVRTLILTTFDLDEYVFAALRAGASGFLLKDTLPDDLLAAVRVIADGDALLAPKVTRRLIEQFASQPVATSASAHHELDLLTERERE